MKVKNFLSDLNFLSQFSNIKYKKTRLLLSIIFVNLSAGLDIVIILVFSKYFSNQISSGFWIVETIFDNMFLFPIVVLLRFTFFYLDKLNQMDFKENMNKDLKVFTLRELYLNGRYSLSDTFFYVNNVSSHVSYFYRSLIQLINNIVQFFVYFLFLVFADIELLFTMLAIGLFLFLPTKFLIQKSSKYADLSYKATKKMASDIQRIIDNLLLIKVLKTSKKEFEKFENSLQFLKNIEIKNQIVKDVNATFPTFSITLILSVFIAFMSILKNLTLDFLGGVLRLVQTVGQINGSLTSLVNSRVHLENFTTLLKDNELNTEYEIKVNSKFEKNALKIQNLDFKYNNSEHFIFKNLEFEFTKNKHYVIVGPNGTGKSTLMGLVGGVLRPNNGIVESCSDNIGYVGANSIIFDDTVKENLVYGLKNIKIDDKVLIEYLKNFKVFEEISLDRLIDNSSLSSGQSQKISYIRALLKGPEILLLDESTSNLDVESKVFINTLLKDFTGTIINVTHNPDDFDYDIKINIEDLTN